MDEAFIRARKPEQKEERRAHLLDTARAVLSDGADLRDLGLNELARRAGMAKANVYRYFESREAVLLALLWDEWERWFATLVERWRPRDGESLTAVAAALARSLARQPRLCALAAALPTVLEQNVSEATIRAFKEGTLEFYGEMASFLAERCPELSSRGYMNLLHDGANAIIALYPGTHPSPAAARVYATPEMRFFRRDFDVELERFVVALAAHHAAVEATRAGTRTRKGRRDASLVPSK